MEENLLLYVCMYEVDEESHLVEEVEIKKHSSSAEG